jgi:hypothetical protein
MNNNKKHASLLIYDVSFYSNNLYYKGLNYKTFYGCN